MSDYGRIVTTNQGKNMVTESIRTHSAIIFTKISLGDGLLNGETIETMTGLKHRLMDGNVPKINHLGNGEIEAVSTVSNSGLTVGFFARELGLFAKLGEEGEEQLFAYTNAGSNASYIPPNTSVDEKMLGIQLGVGDAVVQVNYQSHLYITYEQLEDGIAHHNKDEHAHDDRFNAVIQQVNNMITSVDDSDSLAKAPTLQLVKTILSGLNIKNATDVVNALESEKATGLGIRYDFSNVNAWYICLGKLLGNLIIQGGKFVPEIASITFPIRFNEVLAVLPMMLDEPTPWHEMMIRPKAITASTFKMVSGSNNTNYPKSRNNGCWLAVGI
jgi:hypothetical protein|nr:MAG TPA: tail-collar fiber protein [Caudoviricetes sp.]